MKHGVSSNARNSIWERELGANNPNLGYALTGVGISYLAEGPAQRASSHSSVHQIREAQETRSLAKRAETSFALARALWDSNRTEITLVACRRGLGGYAKAAKLESRLAW